MASELRVNTLKDAAGANSVAMEYVANGSARVWVFHSDVGVSLTDFGISSIVDDGTGINTLNFSSVFSGTQFITSGTCASGSDRNITASSPTTTSIVIETFNTAGSNVASTSSQAMHGDLA